MMMKRESNKNMYFKQFIVERNIGRIRNVNATGTIELVPKRESNKNMYLQD